MPVSDVSVKVSLWNGGWQILFYPGVTRASTQIHKFPNFKIVISARHILGSLNTNSTDYRHLGLFPILMIKQKSQSCKRAYKRLTNLFALSGNPPPFPWLTLQATSPFSDSPSFLLVQRRVMASPLLMEISGIFPLRQRAAKKQERCSLTDVFSHFFFRF